MSWWLVILAVWAVAPITVWVAAAEGVRWQARREARRAALDSRYTLPHIAAEDDDPTLHALRDARRAHLRFHRQFDERRGARRAARR